MKKYPLVYAAVAALLGNAAAVAETSDVEACRKIDDDVGRLACYDSLFGRAEAPNPVEDFGSEQLPVERVDRIEARLVGDFTGWTGQTTFALDNGQVWQQTRNYIPDYQPREPIPQAKVTITRSFAGSYKMRIEGVKRIVQVKRIE